MSDLVGQQLGAYRLLRVLGEGSFASIYLGESPASPGQVAIKAFHKQLSTEEGELFRQDEALLTRLTHPHLVRVLACGVEGSTAFEVMAYVSCGTLRQRHPPGSQVALATIGTYVSRSLRPCSMPTSSTCCRATSNPRTSWWAPSSKSCSVTVEWYPCCQYNKRLPDALTNLLEAAIQAWDSSQSETVRSDLQQATRLAHEMGYL